MTGSVPVRSLDVIYQDQDLVAIHKPPGIHVHPSPLAPAEENCQRLLRRQLGRWVWPVHRLDRATSGVQLFALSAEEARRLSRLFAERRVGKEYLAVVRGFTPASGRIDHPLRERAGAAPAAAVTAYRRLGTVEWPAPAGRHATARFSLLAVQPETGRQNQIRRHLHHVSHPVVGDVNFGDGTQNRYFREHFGLRRLLLMASRISTESSSGRPLVIEAPLSAEIAALFEKFGWPGRL